MERGGGVGVRKVVGGGGRAECSMALHDLAYDGANGGLGTCGSGLVYDGAGWCGGWADATQRMRWMQWMRWF